MKTAALSLLFAAFAAATPTCQAVTSIISIMHQQAVATPFCSSYLHISPVTTTTTVTSTPCPTTTTTTVTSTDTVTSTTVSTYSSGTTTVGQYVAISTTSTCSLSATTVISSSSTAPLQKRATTTTTTTKCTSTYSYTPLHSYALGTPIALTKCVASDISAACSCLNIPTPTKTSVVTTTLAQSTVTSTVASTAKSTVYVTSTFSTWASTYTATQYYTSTFSRLPDTTSTIAPPANPQETFAVYPSLDFAGYDIQNFYCNSQSSPPSPFQGTQCQNFADCVNECAYYNAKGLGGNQTCGAVIYNSPPGTDGSTGSGSCYLKTIGPPCGQSNNYTNAGVLMPIPAYDFQ